MKKTTIWMVLLCIILTTLTAFAAASVPLSISFVPGDKQVTINFTVPANTGGTITKYLVWVLDADNNNAQIGNARHISVTTTQVSGQRSSVTVDGLENGKNYRFKIAAWSNGAQGQATAPIPSTPVVCAGEEILPLAGNPLYAYSIPQGGSLSGKVNTTGAKTFALESGFDTANGTVSVNSSTGEWIYTTPNADFVQKDRSGVNFWIIAKNNGDEEFRTRIQINVEPTPTYLTYYVDGDTGNDDNDGLSYDKALKTINKANEKVKPGDTVLVYDSEVPYGWHEKSEYDSTPGLYQSVRNGAVVLSTSGLPDAPVTYKAAEGQRPVIKANGVWKAVFITGNYINFEGFTVLGQSDELAYEGAFAGLIGKIVADDHPDRIKSWDYVCGIYNTNGIIIEAPTSFNKGDQTKATSNVAHHITIKDCIVKNVSGAGISGSLCDYVTITNCTSLNNGWWDMWATSGINFIKTVDIDDNYDDYKLIVKNCISAGNRHFIPWKINDNIRLSDGNGIMFDTTDDHEFTYQGKSLVANNLVYENGGAGIQSFRSDNIDIVNNTVFNNGATPQLGWAEIQLGEAVNLNLYNNIVYARTGSTYKSYSYVSNVKRDNNIFYNHQSSSDIEVQKDQYVRITSGNNNKFGVDPKFANMFSINRYDAYKPTGFDTQNDYASGWYDTITATDGFSPKAWTYAGNAANAGWYPNANYDVTLLDYDVTLDSTSPAYGAANAQWQAVAGGADYDNVIGIFSEVGAQIEPTENVFKLVTAQYLPGTNQISVSAELNENLQKLNGTVILSLYDNSDRLVWCSPKASSESLQHTFEGLDDYNGSYIVKAFYWGNSTNLTPLCKLIPVTIVTQE